MTPLEALANICLKLGFNIMGIIGENKQRPLVLQRRAAAKEMRAMGFSYPEIGRAMGRHHSTIQYMLKEDFRDFKKSAMKVRSKKATIN